MPLMLFVYDLSSITSFFHILDMFLFVCLERGFIRVCPEVSQ